MLRALGIDPALGRTGLAVVQFWDDAPPCVLAADEFKAPSKGWTGARLDAIHARITYFVKHNGPFDLVGIESSIVGRNIKSSLQLAQAGGVARLAVWQSGCRACYDVPPATAKMAVCGEGGGNAGKEAVAEAVRDLCHLPGGYEDWPHDIYDAVAIAVAARQIHLAA